MKRNRKSHCLWLAIALGIVVAASGCGKGWSVKGGSFPPAARSAGMPPRAEDERGRIIAVEPSQPEMRKEGEDELSRRARELEEKAERLARGLAMLEQEGEGEGSPPEVEEREKGRQREQAGLQQTNQGVESTVPPPLSDVFFSFDSFLLSEEARRILERNAEWLRSHPEAQVVIEGHCDERGTVEYNLALGERRAQSAKDYLVNLGISADRLFTISYGKERPFVLGHTEEAWAQNRRAHFVLRSP